MDDLDQIFMADQKEAMGLGTRFTLIEPVAAPMEPEPDPLDVSMVGVKTAPETSVGDFLAGVADTWGNMLRGSVAGAIGAPGDIEALGSGIKEIFIREGGEGAWEAFQRGFEQETVFPTTEEVGAVLPELTQMSGMSAEDLKTAQGMGEFLPVGVGGAAVTKKIVNKLKPAKIQGVKMTPEALAQNAMAMKNDISSAGVLKKYVESFAGRRNVQKGQLCHDQACRFVMEQGSKPGDKLLMLKTGQKDLVAHSIVVDKAGNLKYDNFGGQWDNKAKSYMAPEVDGAGKPIPQDFRKFTSYEEVDIDLLKKAAEKYKGAK